MGTIQVQVPGGKHGSSHFLSRLPLLLRGGSGVLPFLLFVMPRRWSKALVTDGWVQIIRGPRPKSEKWPKAGQQKVPPKRNQSAVSRGHPQPTRQWERDSALLQRSTSRPPEAATTEASFEVERLEGAIAALGEGNPLSAPLQAALRSARTKSKVLPVNERVEACKGFLERAKKRLVRTEAVIAKAHEQKMLFEAELREGEARLLLPQLRASERIGVRGRCHCGESGSFGGTRVCEDGCIRARYLHKRPGEILSDVRSDRSGRRKEEVHRGNTDGWESGVRNSWYGFRGVRLGEASNPGPPGQRVRDSAEEVLDSLERELTLIESDDEPLVRAATGRNVVPRIHAREPSVVHSDSLATVPASPRALQGVARCEVPDVAPPTVPALPPLPTWVDRDLDESSSVHSESCWGGIEDRNDEEVGGLLLPPAVVHEVREVASQVPVPSHRPRIPSRRLVLVGGRGTGSQNCESSTGGPCW